MDSRKSELRHVTPNLCIGSGGICGSRRALHCVRGVKCQHTIFHAWVGPVRIKKSNEIHFAKLGFCIRWDLWVT
jgi:hypothetical protein